MGRWDRALLRSGHIRLLPSLPSRMNRSPTSKTNPRSPREGRRAYVVGLVGGIGAGKSHVAGVLASRGALALDADRIGHSLLENLAVRDAVVREFGPRILGAEGSIDRKALGVIVFEDKGRRIKLEAILHPLIRAELERRIDETEGVVVLDAAILFEAGWDALCDQIVFVEAPVDIRHRRLRDGRGWSPAEIARREAAQWPLDWKRRRADVILDPLNEPAATHLMLESILSSHSPATVSIPAT